MKPLIVAPALPMTTTIVFLLLGSLASASAVPQKYGLRTWQEGKRTLVQVYNLKTKQIIWTHRYPGSNGTAPDNGKFFWSQDRRAVAFSVDGAAQPPKRNKQLVPLTIWRAGERVHTVFYQPNPIGDYTEDMTWSPNDRDIVIRDGGSGMADTNLGRMACLDVETQQTYQLELSIGRPVWISPRTIKFWQADFSRQHNLGIIKATHPSFWSFPAVEKKRIKNRKRINGCI